MTQTLASILFFVVFIELFIALSIYLGVTLYRFFKNGQPKDHPMSKDKER
jgi:hypothetical protein